MKKILHLILLALSFSISHSITGQRGTERFDETNVFIGYGTSNLLSIVNIPASNDPYIPGFYIEGGKQLNDLKFIKGGVYLNISGVRNNVNLRTLNLLPLVATFGIEKAWQKEKVVLSTGIMGYLSMSTRFNRISRFRTDDYGFGIAPNLSIGYLLRPDLLLKVQSELGLGLYRYFNNVGFVTRQALEGDIRFLKSLSVGLQHNF
jgi:hypothetical protein